MSNKFGHFQKQKVSRFGQLLADGVVNYEGEKWAKHRRILNPAFHVEKLKVIFDVYYKLARKLNPFLIN
jgi:cytochrome P450